MADVRSAHTHPQHREQPPARPEEGGGLPHDRLATAVPRSRAAAGREPADARTPELTGGASDEPPARRGFVALDVGTARTRSVSSGGCAIADRPSAVVGRPSGVPGPVRPVRHGVVADPAAYLRLVRLVLLEARWSGAWPPERVLTGVPVAATPDDRRVVSAAVAEVAGCEATLVEGPLAAAVGAGLDVTGPRPCLLLDVGAGLVEAVVIDGGVITDAAVLQLSATTGTGLPLYALDGVVDMTAGLLRRLPGRLRSAGLVVTGGGARQERLLERLRAALRVPVGAAPEPEHATIRGLVGLCPQPVPAARTTARGR
ncbi:rod shape-determining protein [Streptosporangium sandarakinum]|uniref:rod shape-determining protein n=1 Tax=Streptosporangium nondiastaticum TaxID=35764 RepID=UPI0031F7A313